jgi:hypothetical protein
VLLHPSPLVVSPSSHSSPLSTALLPQTAFSIWQVLLHPSLFEVLPSSHCSVPSTTPLPQTGCGHAPQSFCAWLTQAWDQELEQQEASRSHTQVVTWTSFEPGPGCTAQASPQLCWQSLMTSFTQMVSHAVWQQ